MKDPLQIIEVLPDRMQLDIHEFPNGPQEIVEIDLTGATSKSTLLEVIGSGMGFSDYFGHNWDALEECFRDLKKTKQGGWFLIFGKADSLLSLPKQDLATFLSILSDVTAFWKVEGYLFKVAFIGSPSLAAEIRDTETGGKPGTKVI